MSADSGRPAPAPSGDADLVRLSLAGSAQASETLVRRFERPVYNLIVRMVRNEATAEDLAQDTFLKMFRALSTYKQEMRFSSWLLRIAHNTTIDYLRQRRLLTVGPAEDADGEEHDPLDALPDLDAISPEQSSVRRELASAVDRALDRLRPDFRAVVVLRYQEGLDYQEIAQVLGVPLGTVKTFLHRARRQLARELGAAGWAPETPAGTQP
jgi:RNA polymerase sigma-70 factor, ECF subfamily